MVRTYWVKPNRFVVKRGDKLYGVIKTCDICGITSDKKPVYFSQKFQMNLCNKHNCQLRLRGKILDTKQRSVKDSNDYEICDDYVKMYTYNSRSEIDSEFIFDTEDLEKVLQHKWRTVHKKKNYIVTGNNKKFPITYLARYVMDCPDEFEIDHINGNTMDNRKSNLRIADSVIQTGNLAPKYTNKIGVRGVSYSERDKNYVVDFSYDKQRVYLKSFDDVNKAVYARYMLEFLVNPTRYKENDEYIKTFADKLSLQEKDEIETYVCSILLQHENIFEPHVMKGVK